MRFRPLLHVIAIALSISSPTIVPPLTARAMAQGDALPPLPRPRPPREGDAPQSEPATTPGDATAADAIDAATAVPQPVRLLAQVIEAGPPIGSGLVWRVFDTRTDETGELALVAKSEEASASLSLPPGEYVLHVAYGQAQTSDSLTVGMGDNEKTVVLDAGGLQLSASITGEIPVPSNLLRFDIFNGGASEADRTAVAQDLAPGDIVTLNAGTYHVVSRFGPVNAVVRADLRVEAGKLTSATLYHKAAEVSFKLVSEAGGEAIADVEWTVKTAGGATVFSDLGAFPSTVLAEGDYLVLAKRGETVFNREFAVVPGQPVEIEVLTTVF